MTRVLLIEDNQMVRDTLHQQLVHAGYEVQLAANGKEGVEIVRSQGTDILVTDIIMPVMEGIETIVSIRKLQQNLPIIAISGGGNTSDFRYLEMAEKLGANFTLNKPFKAGQLIELIEACISADNGNAG